MSVSAPSSILVSESAASAFAAVPVVSSDSRPLDVDPESHHSPPNSPQNMSTAASRPVAEADGLIPQDTSVNLSAPPTSSAANSVVAPAASRRLSLTVPSLTAKQQRQSNSASFPPVLSSSMASAADSSSFSAKRNSIVFVDPDDSRAPWWWPAIVVTPKEFQEYRKTVDIEVDEPKDGEYLVCYFEDGSFSIIPESDAMPFNPTLPPYTTYLNGSEGYRFKRDNAVRLATDFWEKGIPPPTFGWLLPAGASSTVNGNVQTEGSVLGGTNVGSINTVSIVGNSKKSRSSNQLNNADPALPNGRKLNLSSGSLLQQTNAAKKAKRDNNAGMTGGAVNAADSKSRKTSPPETGGVQSRSRHRAYSIGIAAGTQNTKRPTGSSSRLPPEKQVEGPRDSSSVEPSPGQNHAVRNLNGGSYGVHVPNQSASKRGSKSDAAVSIATNNTKQHQSSSSPVATGPQQSFRPRGSITQPLPAQIIIGSNFGQPVRISPIHKYIKPFRAKFSLSNKYYTSSGQQQVLGITHQLYNRYLHSANLDHVVVHQNYQQQQQQRSQLSPGFVTAVSVNGVPTNPGAVVASTNGGANVNPFAPICVMKRSERADVVMLSGMVPVGRRNLLSEKLRMLCKNEEAFGAATAAFGSGRKGDEDVDRME
ncbi:hypothetical protein HDU83_009017 [Entophlyctis luteolus]|nr:hypothetical protein HDU83_009017 [Entophlyctis luteolus]